MIRWLLFNLPATIFAWLAGRKLVPLKKDGMTTEHLPPRGIDWDTEVKRMQTEAACIEDMHESYMKSKISLLLKKGEMTKEDEEELVLLLLLPCESLERGDHGRSWLPGRY